MKNKRLIGITSVSILIILILGIVLFTTRQSADTPDRLLSLGEKYLTELNYEQALAQFLKVIEIDPMNPRGYTGAAEAYVGLGRTDEAMAILKQGLERTNDDRIRGMLSRLEAEIAGDAVSGQNNDTNDNVTQKEPKLGDIVQDADYSITGVPYTLDRLNVPYINIASDDVRQVNEQIYSYFQDVAMAGDPNPGGFDSTQGSWYTDIDYTYFINGDILSVIVIKESGGTAPPIHEVFAYNLNIKSGKLLTYGDLATYTGQESSSVYDSFAGLALRKVTEEYRGYDNSEIMERDIAATYAINKAWFEAGRMPWFVNGDGKLCGFVYLSLGLVSSGNCLSCYTEDGRSVSVSAGSVSLEEGLSDAWKPVSDASVPDTMVGTWNFESTPGNNTGKIQFDGPDRFIIETNGQSETYGYSYDSDNGLLSLNIPGEETLCYAKLIDESKIMLYTDSNVVWMDSDNGYEFDTESYYFTLSGIVFDIDDLMLLTRAEDIPLQTMNTDNPAYSNLTSGYWVNDGFRLSDTVIYRFELGENNSPPGNVSGVYYWDYFTEPKGSWREAQNYTLYDNVLTLYDGTEIFDILDFDSATSQFISRMKKQLVEQERMENGVHIPAKTQPYSLSNRSDDPRF